MRENDERRWFWTTLLLSSISIVAFVFAIWELVENRFFRDFDYLKLHYLYITRGVACSLLLAVWAAWYVLRQRRHTEQELRRSRERYRGLLEASPGAVALYDSELRVSEWNASAERLYGFSKSEVLGQLLPTVPLQEQGELRSFLERVARGQPVLDVETLRCAKDGGLVEVQFSLLPFREPDGQNYFLEVTADIRERVRLRQKLLEIEKLTSMGRMAAGTAHHLNTPLAAMLLRLEMMRDRTHHEGCAADLKHLEESLRFCQQFVRRLLDFSRCGTPADKQPQPVRSTVESIVSFLRPTILAKRARVSLQLGLDGEHILADRNQLEALVLILLSNALDAIGPQGTVMVRAQPLAGGWIELRIEDDGCGIAEADLPRVFEPFFTTKPPGKGTGLGLPMARNIVLDHGGSIRLESQQGQGTTVSMQFPVCPAAARRQRV